MTQLVIGVDIGGTKIAAGLIHPEDGLLHHERRATPPDPQAILDTVVELCGELERATDSPFAAVGVGTAGQVDYASGSISFASDNIPNWTGTPIAERLRPVLGVPVVVDNDVNAMALGESRMGAGIGYQHVLYIAVGTGIGGAIVHNGQLWRGAHFSAGEIGYLVAGWDDTTPLTVEALCAGPGIAHHYNTLTGSALTLYDIAALAADGDTQAVEIIQGRARLLGEVLGGAVCLLDPQVVIVGGGVPGIGALWWEPFEAGLRAHALPARRDVQVLSAQFDTHAVMIGAGQLALEAIS